MTRRISYSTLPKNSIVKEFINIIDYKDTFKVQLDKADISIEEIYLNIFSYSPKWVDNLLNLRNKIVKPFGIITVTNEIKKENVKVGEKSGIFNIYAITENEIIAGENEKHLDFRVSILKDNETLTISTLVQYNNCLGKLYFFIVKPFHKIVVKSMMKNAVKNNRI